MCDVCSGVIYISNKSKYLKTEMRYTTAVKSNLYNFKRSFKHSTRVFISPNISFHISFDGCDLPTLKFNISIIIFWIHFIQKIADVSAEVS